VVLPRLELFADAGYPFTRWADLGRTAIVLPEAPTAADYETLLNMAGFFGAQTGAPATAILTVTAAEVGEAPARDRDLILLGTAASQPLLAAWGRLMPVDLSRGRRLTDAPAPSRLRHPQWPFRSGDRPRLAEALQGGRRCDVVVQQFVSPLRAERAAVAIVPCDSGSQDTRDTVASLFMPSLRQGPVYGGVSLAAHGTFDSFLVGSDAYRTGVLTTWERALVLAIENYWLMPPLIIAVAVGLGAGLRAATDSIAAQRLAAGSTRG
jgi:cellulose synthase (UDP-forming)